MIVRVSLPNNSVGSAGPVSLRCPACRQIGSFEPLPTGQNTYPDVLVNESTTGQPIQRWMSNRRCPNPVCKAHVFMVLDAPSQKLLVSYPPERLDFDASNIPTDIVDCFEEAITCHANSCFTAAGIMVRKTLEVMCENQNATGKTLKDRIQSLRSAVILPGDLFDGLDELRLLGNDAAHIELKDFDKISKEEIDVGIEFTKEILKALYQYGNLLQKIRSLKKTP